jgi:hypothetical protein
MVRCLGESAIVHEGVHIKLRSWATWQEAMVRSRFDWDGEIVRGWGPQYGHDGGFDAVGKWRLVSGGDLHTIQAGARIRREYLSMVKSGSMNDDIKAVNARDGKVVGLVHLAFPGASQALCGHYFYFPVQYYRTGDAANCDRCLKVNKNRGNYG